MANFESIKMFTKTYEHIGVKAAIENHYGIECVPADVLDAAFVEDSANTRKEGFFQNIFVPITEALAAAKIVDVADIDFGSENHQTVELNDDISLRLDVGFGVRIIFDAEAWERGDNICVYVALGNRRAWIATVSSIGTRQGGSTTAIGEIFNDVEIAPTVRAFFKYVANCILKAVDAATVPEVPIEELGEEEAVAPAPAPREADGKFARKSREAKRV